MRPHDRGPQRRTQRREWIPATEVRTGDLLAHKLSDTPWTYTEVTGWADKYLATSDVTHRTFTVTGAPWWVDEMDRTADLAGETLIRAREAGPAPATLAGPARDDTPAGTWLLDGENRPVVAWVACYRCSGDLFIEPQTLPRSSGLPGDGPEVYCRKCKPIVDGERARRPCVPGARCVHVDYPRGPFAGLVVRQVAGDRIRCMVMSFPDGVPDGAGKFHHTIGREWFTRGELIMTGLQPA